MRIMFSRSMATLAKLYPYMADTHRSSINKISVKWHPSHVVRTEELSAFRSTQTHIGCQLMDVNVNICLFKQIQGQDTLASWSKWMRLLFYRRCQKQNKSGTWEWLETQGINLEHFYFKLKSSCVEVQPLNCKALQQISGVPLVQFTYLIDRFRKWFTLLVCVCSWYQKYFIKCAGLYIHKLNVGGDFNIFWSCLMLSLDHDWRNLWQWMKKLQTHTFDIIDNQHTHASTNQSIACSSSLSSLWQGILEDARNNVSAEWNIARHGLIFSPNVASTVLLLQFPLWK